MATKVYEIGEIEPGTKMVFRQSSAPVGWIIDSTYNDCTVRCTTSAISQRTSGVNFMSFFSSKSGTSGSTAITLAYLPSHRHGISANYNNSGGGYPAHSSDENGNADGKWVRGTTSTYSGGGATIDSSPAGHAHSITVGFGSSTNPTVKYDFSIKYVDYIIATKD